MNFTLKRPLSLVAAGAALWAVTALPAHAVLKHQYTFNSGTANDSVGGVNATIVNPANAVFTAGGQLDVSLNAGQASNAGTITDAYVDLPNLIIENAANSGTSGAISLEYWFTVSTHRTWQWIGGFAGPLAAGGSEGVTDNGAVSYLLVTPSSGRNNQGAEISNNTGGLGENVLGQSGPAQPALAPGVQHHIVGVWDKTNLTAGPGGTMAMYLNGVNILPGGTNVNGTNAIREDFNLNDLNDEDNWLGRSQWPDPIFDGSFNEFNIYDHPLTQADVTAKFTSGPVPVPLPTLIVNTVTGATAIKNLASGAIDIDYYEIASTGGRLNATTWNSLSDQNLDAGLPADFNNSNTVDGADLTVWKGAFGVNANGDADGDGDTDGNDFVVWQRQVNQAAGAGDSWDEAGGISDNLLAELYLNNASTMSPNEQFNLGNAFRTGGAQDLTFKFAIKGEGGLTNGLVQYVTTGPATAIPEPAACGLAIIAAAALFARRRS